MELDPTGRNMYRLLTTITVPRPIGWISSVDGDGQANLAPYSHYNNVCGGQASPPVVMFSAGPGENGLKHTPRNVLETGEFVVNLVTEPLAERMDMTSATVEESEFEFADLEREPAATVAPPRVAESPAHLECTLYDSMDVYENTVILGEVVHVHVDDSLLTDGKIDTRKVDAVGRLGGPHYTGIDILEQERQY